MKKQTSTILNLSFVNNSFSDFLTTLEGRINERKNTFVVTANPEIAYYAHYHSSYQKLIQSSDYITPDGIGIVKAAKILHQPMIERISGYDLFVSLLKWGNQNSKSVYFLGAKPKIISNLIKVINQKYPYLTVTGYHDGYFKNDERIIKNIKDKKPEMIFVALGSPKQEEFIYKHRDIDDALWMGLGGSFDVLSGHANRAPQFWVDHHGEWLYRLIKQPSRINRVAKIPKFLRLVHKQKNKKLNK